MKLRAATGIRRDRLWKLPATLLVLALVGESFLVAAGVRPRCTPCGDPATHQALLVLGIAAWSLLIGLDYTRLRSAVPLLLGAGCGTHTALVSRLVATGGFCPTCVVALALSVASATVFCGFNGPRRLRICVAALVVACVTMQLVP